MKKASCGPRWHVNALSRTFTPRARIRIARLARFGRRYYHRHDIKDDVRACVHLALATFADCGRDV